MPPELHEPKLGSVDQRFFSAWNNLSCLSNIAILESVVVVCSVSYFCKYRSHSEILGLQKLCPTVYRAYHDQDDYGGRRTVW